MIKRGLPMDISKRIAGVGGMVFGIRYNEALNKRFKESTDETNRQTADAENPQTKKISR